MSANVDSGGIVRQLDRRPEPDETITEEKVKDSRSLARFLLRLFRDVARLKRRWAPRHLDFEDVAVDDSGTNTYRFAHNFGGRVRFWPVDVTSLTPVSFGLGTAALPPVLVQHSDSDENTLVLVSYVEAVLSLRVEEAG